MSSDENLGRWLLDARHPPDAVAIVDATTRITRAELARRARAVAAFIRARLGAAPAPVLVVGDASIELCATYLGGLLSGATVVLLSPRDDVDHAARQTQAGLVLGGIAIAGGATFDDALAYDGGNGATALVLYTSGSTGEPKGVELSRRNIVASTEAILRAAPVAPSDRTLSVLPLHYCYGLSILHTHLRAGATLVLGGSEFPDAIVDRMHAEQITGLVGVPSLFQILVRRSSLLDRPPSGLRALMTSGGRIDPEIVDRLRRGLPRTAITLRYGVTEATSAVSCLDPEELERRGISIGRGLPGLPLRVERADGGLVEPGSDEIGEIVVHGDHVARGYLGDPEGSAQVFVDGAFRTGDLARLDVDGYAHVVGRTREFVKTAGHRVSPQEVEGVLARLDGVVEVAVHGIPHAIRGEALAAVFVARPDLSRADVQRFCAANLPSHKVPVELRCVAALPRGSNGKILRVQLPGLGEPLR